MNISPHPESVSGTPQSSYRCHSSRTPLRRSAQDTCPRSPCRAEGTLAWPARNGTALQPGLPASAPVVQCRYAEANKNDREKEKTEKKDPFTCWVQRSTHRSTDMFWINSVKGRANLMLSGRWKQPLRRALPSETHQGKKKY